MKIKFFVGCDSKFKYLNNLTTHKKTHESLNTNSNLVVPIDTKKLFQCEHCNESFEKKCKLLSHQKKLCEFSKKENGDSLDECKNLIEIDRETKTRLEDNQVDVFQVATENNIINNLEIITNNENDISRPEKTKTQYYTHSSIDDCIQKPKKIKHTHVININSGNFNLLF